MPGRTNRTTQPHDFLDLSDGQFEDLVRQLAGTSGVDWAVLQSRSGGSVLIAAATSEIEQRTASPE